MGEDKDYFIKCKLRKKVETAFSIITGKFENVIKATSIDSFLKLSHCEKQLVI